MFREMRLKEQQLSNEEAISILKEMTHGTLAINGDGPYPYSVPVSFVYEDGKIYFHGAMAGQKYDLLTADPHVCLSVVALDDVQPDKFTTYYRSVMVYGDMKRLEAPEEIQKAMEATIKKYSSDFMEGGRAFIEAQQGNFCAYEMTICHMTAKRSE